MLLDYASSPFFISSLTDSLTDLASKKHDRVQFNTELFFLFQENEYAE